MGSWGSKDSQVHFANGLGRQHYVLVTPNPDWAWADIAASVAVGAAITAVSGGAGGPAAAAAATQLTTTARAVKTAKDLWALYSAFQKFRRVATAVSATALREANNLVAGVVDPLKKLSHAIPPNAYRLVNKDDYLAVWNSVNPSYWGSIAGASTVQLTVFDDSVDRLCTFCTGADESWIATEMGIVRSRYGTLWQQNPTEGWYEWDNDHIFDGVVIYEHSNFGGASQNLSPGRYNMNQIAIGNDRLSSIRVPPGWSITLYQDKNFCGSSARFTGDTSYVGSAYNDWASSVLVTGPEITGAIIYQHTEYQGRSQVLAPGRYNVNALTIGNDKLSSIRLPAGWSITLYRDADYQGPSVTFRGDTSYVGDAYNDWASSIIVTSASSAGVVIYKDSNYSGPSQMLSAGQYDLSRIAIGNDSLSSMRIPPGWRVTLYEHSGFRGGSVTFSRDTSYVGDRYNDWTSSLVVSYSG